MDEHAERPYKVGWYREIYNGDMNRHFRIDKVSKNTLVIAYDDGFKNNKLSIPIRKKIYTKAGNPAMASFGKKYLMLDGHNKNAHKTFLKDWCLMMKGGSIDDYEKVKSLTHCLDECCDADTDDEDDAAADDSVPMGGEIAVAQITEDTKCFNWKVALKLLKDKDKEIISLEYDLSHAADINTTQQKQIERLTTELKNADIALTQVLKNLNK
tara:strand:+ start:394 stop:1029 length:636 start_codon:yes stop_codon:yes gene_type:complete